MKGRSNRRHPNDSTAAAAAAAAAQQTSSARISDASLTNKRPSSSSVGVSRSAAVPISDRAYQQSAARTVTAYLCSKSFPITLKNTLPSAREITEILKFLLSRLDFPTEKPEEDLPTILKHLNCPIKLNKSAMRALNTPHSWPSLLAVIHWLVQICSYNDPRLDSSGSSHSFFHDNTMFQYILQSYLHYIRGEDEEVEALDEEFIGKLRHAKGGIVERVAELEKEKEELGLRLEGIKSSPSPRELLAKEKAVLEADMRKFHTLIEQFVEKVTASESALAEKERLLGVKEGERRKVFDENSEIERRIDGQGVSCRDAERMRRELQALERETADSESSRSSWEEKSFELDAAICRKYKEIEEAAVECNAVIRRLKIGGDFKFVLNAEGSTAVDVLGLDYRSTVKPVLDSVVEKVEKNSMDGLKEMITLKHMSVENNARIESKRIQIAQFRSIIGETEIRIRELETITRDYLSRVEDEGLRMMKSVEDEFKEMDSIEEEAEGMLKVSKSKLEEVVSQTEEEVRMCASELWALVDMVLRCKESVEANISDMMKDVLDTYESVRNIYKSSFSHGKEDQHAF